MHVYINFCTLIHSFCVIWNIINKFSRFLFLVIIFPVISSHHDYNNNQEEKASLMQCRHLTYILDILESAILVYQFNINI